MDALPCYFTYSMDAEAEQLDLFYLVDCVLDEIEQVKKGSTVDTKSDTDLDEQHEMPVVTEDYFATDLMDHIESALHPYDSRSQYFPYYDVPHSSQPHHYIHHHQSFTPPAAHQSPTGHVLADLIDDVDDEYLNHVEKEEYIQSPVSISNVDIQNAADGKLDQLSIKRESHSLNHPANHDKEYLQNCQEVQQKYSDLITFPEMTSNSTSVSSSSTAPSTNVILSTGISAPSAFQQQPRALFIQQHDHYDENSSDTSSSDFMSWTLKHPENWSATEVLDWLYYSAEKHGVDCSLLRGEAFRTVNGSMLCKMTCNDFTALEPCFGRIFYDLLQEKLSCANFPPVPVYGYEDGTDFDMAEGYIESQTYKESIASSPCSRSDVTSPCSRSHVSSLSPGHLSNQTSPDGYPEYQQWRGLSDAGHMSDLTQTQYAVQSYPGYVYGYQTCHSFPVSPRSQQYGRTKSTTREKYETPTGVPRRRPGRPRIKSIPTEEELQAQREKKLKSQHLWEFIFEILSNPLYNPSILKWENQSEGVFRFVQSESVAQLWGTLKSNENMTYEKLSRAMRHYYKRGILERVEGRRLVYKYSLSTLERLQQKKLQLVEMTAAKYNFAREKALNNGQYTITTHPKDTSSAQYTINTHNINTSHGEYSVVPQDTIIDPNANRYCNSRPGESAKDEPIQGIPKGLEYSYTNTSQDQEVHDSGAFSLPKHEQNVHFNMPTLD